MFRVSLPGFTRKKDGNAPTFDYPLRAVIGVYNWSRLGLAVDGFLHAR